MSDALASYIQNLPSTIPLFEGELPFDVEVCMRQGVGNHRVFVVVNHSRRQTTHLVLAVNALNLLSDTHSNSIDLPPQGVAVFDTNFEWVTND